MEKKQKGIVPIPYTANILVAQRYKAFALVKEINTLTVYNEWRREDRIM